MSALRRAVGYAALCLLCAVGSMFVTERAAAGRSAVPPGLLMSAVGKAVAGTSGEIWSATVPGTAGVPADALDLDRGCGALDRWALATGAVPRGTANAAFTLQAPGDRPLLVRRVRAVKGPAVPLPQGQDVSCVRGDDPTVGPWRGAGQELNLDSSPVRNVGWYLRPGGVTGGVLAVSTTSCSCEWWIELDVIDGGTDRTVRIDDGGRPFRVAPPVAPIATPADFESQNEIPLARSSAPADPDRPSVRGMWSYAREQEPWVLAAPGTVPGAERAAADMDVPGVSCDGIHRALMNAGSRRVGSGSLVLALSAPSASVVADVTVHLEAVDRSAGRRTVYACTPDLGNEWIDMAQQQKLVELDTGRVVDVHWPDLGPMTPNAAGPQSAKTRPGDDIPVVSGETLQLTPADLPSGLTGGTPVSRIYLGADARWAGYRFTIEVTLTQPSGRTDHFTLSDNGKPFELVGEASLDRGSPHRSLRELGRKIG